MGSERIERQRRELDRVVKAGDGDSVDVVVPANRMQVGAVGDPAEARADRLAASALAHLRSSTASPTPVLAAAGSRAGRVRRSIGSPAGGAVGRDGGVLDPHSSRQLRAEQGSGRAIDESLRSSMEDAFGRSFGSVRIHDDGTSARIARSMNAEAFTVGRHIHFAGGAYRPDDEHGRDTLAHELGHVADAGSHGDVSRRVVRRRFAYTLADIDRAAPKKALLRIPLKKDPLEPLRKVMKGYEKVPTFQDEVWFVQQIQDAADAFLAAVRGDQKYRAVVSVVEDIAFAARAEVGKLRAKAIYLRDAGAGAATQGYDPRNPYAKKPEVPSGAVPLRHQFNGAKQVVTDPALALGRGTTSGATGNDGKSDRSFALVKQYGLDAADIAAVRAYSNDDFKYINPAVENQAWSTGQLGDLVNGDDRIAAQTAAGMVDASGGHWHEADPTKRSAKVAEMQQEGRLQAGMLVGALQKMESKHLQVYRGMSLSEAELSSRFSGEVTWGSFTSTTVSTAVATLFADGAQTPYDRSTKDLHATLVIDACAAYDLQDFSVQGDKEGEYLLLPGTRLSVVGVERQRTPFPETTPETVRGRRDGVREYVRIRLKQLPAAATTPKNQTRPTAPRPQRAAWAPAAAPGVKGARAQRASVRS